MRLIVPYPAGGAVDGASRILAERLSSAWGQPVIVENRPGASGRIGVSLAEKSPHSYTFVAATNSTLNEQLTRGEAGAPPPAANLLPVSTLFTTPVALLVNREAVPADNLAQYVELAESDGNRAVVPRRARAICTTGADRRGRHGTRSHAAN